MRTASSLFWLVLLSVVVAACCALVGCSALAGDAGEDRASPSVTVNVSPVATNAYGASQGSGSTTEAWGDTSEGGRAQTGGGSTATPTTTTSVNPSDVVDAPTGR